MSANLTSLSFLIVVFCLLAIDAYSQSLNTQPQPKQSIGQNLKGPYSQTPNYQPQPKQKIGGDPSTWSPTSKNFQNKSRPNNQYGKTKSPYGYQQYNRLQYGMPYGYDGMNNRSSYSNYGDGYGGYGSYNSNSMQSYYMMYYMSYMNQYIQQLMKEMEALKDQVKPK